VRDPQMFKKRCFKRCLNNILKIHFLLVAIIVTADSDLFELWGHQKGAPHIPLDQKQTILRGRLCEMKKKELIEKERNNNL